MNSNSDKLAEMANRMHDDKRSYFISTINLFLTICIGLIAFIFSSFDSAPIDYQNIWWLRIGLISLSSSIVIGIIASYSQYKHYYYMALVLSGYAANLMNHNNEYKKSKKWSEIVKRLFDFQLATMLVGLLFIGIYYVLRNNIW